MIDLMGLYDVAEKNGIVIDEFRMDRNLSFSIMDSDGDCFIAIDPTKLESYQQEKIVLGHEIGHCQTGSFYNSYSPFDVRRKRENQADRWMFQALVTKKDLSEAVENGFQEVWELSELFDVPPEIMARICHWYKYHNMDYQEVV